MISLVARRRIEEPEGSNKYILVHEQIKWDPKKTAVVISDMWDRHWCKGATRRVAEMAPRMNKVLKELRDKGVLIIHGPSDTMDFYKDHPGRIRAQSAPIVETSVPFENAGRLDLEIEKELPVDSSDGGCACKPQCKQGSPWRRQIEILEIKDEDAITDSIEAFYLMKQRGITNVIVMGVHTNMCILGRPFTIRQMVKQGQNVVLMRDLTDSMYNPDRFPWVDHFTGTDLVIEHIEKYWCPTITSDQVIGGEPFRFLEDTRYNSGTLKFT